VYGYLPSLGTEFFFIGSKLDSGGFEVETSLLTVNLMVEVMRSGTPGCGSSALQRTGRRNRRGSDAAVAS
jgi:hypothetical protein